MLHSLDHDRHASLEACETMPSPLRHAPRRAAAGGSSGGNGAHGRPGSRAAGRVNGSGGGRSDGSGGGLGGGSAGSTTGPDAGSNGEAGDGSSDGPRDATGGGTDDARHGGKIAYYFGTAPTVAHDEGTVRALDALADAMVEQRPDEIGQDAAVPPIHTFFGQLVDHDVSCCADSAPGAAAIGAADFAPLRRRDVAHELHNLRHGSLRLDSVYGDGPGNGALPKRLTDLMRHPTDRAKMRLGATVRVPGQSLPLPKDPEADLLRIGRLIAADPIDGITGGELRALPGDLPARFLDERGEPIGQRAVIGDARNDGNLVLAQLHVALLRFHNRTVDFLRDSGTGSPDPDTLHGQARKLVTWHYQWLIVNDFLARRCREDVLAFVLARSAPLYTRFLERHGTGDAERLPVPLEFSAAAARFGQSTVRGAYDYNRFFGTETDEGPANRPEANIDLLLRFTGRGAAPMPRMPGGRHERLPSNWVIDWTRFVGEPSGTDTRASRRIDTFLSPPHGELADGADEVFEQLARENLRRGHALALPSAQECVLGYNAIAGTSIEKLRRDELLSGSTGQTVAAEGLDEETPLWFYVLKEAEVRENGERLGMLGSALVAETLVGLIVNDPRSYWNARGSDEGRWHPIDGVRGPDGEQVDSLPALLRAAGVL